MKDLIIEIEKDLKDLNLKNPRSDYGKGFNEGLKTAQFFINARYHQFKIKESVNNLIKK